MPLIKPDAFEADFVNAFFESLKLPFTGTDFSTGMLVYIREQFTGAAPELLDDVAAIIASKGPSDIETSGLVYYIGQMQDAERCGIIFSGALRILLHGVVPGIEYPQFIKEDELAAKQDEFLMGAYYSDLTPRRKCEIHFLSVKNYCFGVFEKDFGKSYAEMNLEEKQENAGLGFACSIYEKIMDKFLEKGFIPERALSRAEFQFLHRQRPSGGKFDS